MNRRPSSSETGRSSETGVSDRKVFIFSSFSAAMPVAAAISCVVGGRSSFDCSSRWDFAMRWYASIMCTGRRTARPLSASARLIACRIHQVA